MRQNLVWRGWAGWSLAASWDAEAPGDANEIIERRSARAQGISGRSLSTELISTNDRDECVGVPPARNCDPEPLCQDAGNAIVAGRVEERALAMGL
jgi:hypothetical protein